MVPGGQPDRLYTLLLAQGVHSKIVQELLGHADISMTLNRYSHVTPDMQRSAADRLDSDASPCKLYQELKATDRRPSRFCRSTTSSRIAPRMTVCQ
jgi:hypothetical protein